MNTTGFSLIEVMVAVALLTLLSAAATSSLVATARAQQRLHLQLRAHQLAAETMEIALAGHADSITPSDDWETLISASQSAGGLWTWQVAIESTSAVGIESRLEAIARPTGSP